MSNRRLLIAVAHPDDESFGYGGLITRYISEGVDVYAIVSTDGGAGTVAPEFLNGYNSVSELRLAELDCAAEKLGFKKVFKFGYKDSGMMGSETSKDPACSWQAPREELARKVVEVIREIQPQVIVTFNKYGGYGHPDHIAIFGRHHDMPALFLKRIPFTAARLAPGTAQQTVAEFVVVFEVLRGFGGMEFHGLKISMVMDEQRADG